MRQMETFFRQPAGAKLIEKWLAIVQQTALICQDVSGKAAEELRLRLIDARASQAICYVWLRRIETRQSDAFEDAFETVIPSPSW
jgi:hypothetical protein